MGAGAQRGQWGRKGAGATGGQGARTSEAASPVRRGRARAGERRVEQRHGMQGAAAGAIVAASERGGAQVRDSRHGDDVLGRGRSGSRAR